MNLSVATVVFAAIIAALIAMPAPTPQTEQTAPAASADRPATRSSVSPCAQQNWPNFDTACLRYLNRNQEQREARGANGQS
jgi:hypothetical protein